MSFGKKKECQKRNEERKTTSVYASKAEVKTISWCKIWWGIVKSFLQIKYKLSTSYTFLQIWIYIPAYLIAFA